MAIQKKTEGRDLDEYLQEVWDSLESAWDKSKFDMKQGYDSEYECDCITITSKDNEGVLAKIYVNDYEGKHPVGFDVVYRYPGDKGVGVMGSYEFQSTDMDGLGEEVFDYFDEIKKKAAGASFESDLQAYADAVKADKYDKQSVIDDGWEFYNSVEYDEDIVRDDFKQKYDGKTYLLHITFNPSTKDVSDVKWDISAIESKKSEEAGSFKVGDFVNYDAESDGKDVYDSFIPCEVVDVNDDGTLGLCVYGSYADEEGLGEKASASCCRKLDNYAGMVDANTYYTDGKYKAYKGGWEILVTEKELDPEVYEFIGTMDDLSEVVDFDDYYGGENFVYDEDLRDDLGATGVDTDGVDFADMSGDVAKASGSPEESKKSEAQKIVDNGVVSFRETKHPRELRKLYKACQDRFGVSDYVSYMKEDISRDGADCQYKINGITEDDKPIIIEMNYYGDSGDYKYTIDVSLLATAGGSSLDSIGNGGPSPNFDKALNSAMASVDKYLQELPIRNDESKKSEGLPPKKLGDRKYRSRADLINKMKQVGATEITTRDQYDELRNKQWLHKGGYAMDINGNLVGQTYFGDKDGKWYYATTKTFQGDYLPECKQNEASPDVATIEGLKSLLGRGIAVADNELRCKGVWKLNSKNPKQHQWTFVGDNGSISVKTDDDFKVIRIWGDLNKKSFDLGVSENKEEAKKSEGDEDKVVPDENDFEKCPYCGSHNTDIHYEVDLAKPADVLAYATCKDCGKEYHGQFVFTGAYYGKDEHDYDPIDTCPFCGSKEHTETVQFDGGGYVDQDFKCKSCGGTWYNSFVWSDTQSAFESHTHKAESKKSESLTLKQKELKDMARFGQAEDITTISDEEAKALRKKGIETVGISRGTYGMNGALLRDNEGKKYVITARSSNLFYFV